MSRCGLREIGVAASLVLALGCGSGGARTRAVYLLVDTSGTYAKEVDKAKRIATYLLLELGAGDSLALGRIDSASFSEKNVVAKTRFDDRPSFANQQKRAFQRELDRFVRDTAGSGHTDITGGVMQAAEWLRETGAERRTILVFSDLEEDLRPGYVRDFGIDLAGIDLIAVNVTKLSSDQVDPRDYTSRLDRWGERVRQGGGSWQVLNDLERLDRLLD